MTRRRKRRNRRAWYFTGLMFLLLTGIMLYGSKDADRPGGSKTEKHDAAGKEESLYLEKHDTADKEESLYLEKHDTADEKEPSYLESIDGEEAGTVLEASQLDPQRMSAYFTIHEIQDDILEYISGKSYVENDHIHLDDLRYLKLLHYNYDHEIQVGELIVNVQIAKDCREVFAELFSEEYEIESMYLIDKFWNGDSVESDTNSIEHNNTSAFNYRVVPNTDRLSNHAAGFAIDINPLQNPYVKYNSDGSFAKYYKDMEKYTDRSQKEAHMITHDDICYKVFEKHGFTWGGDWKNSKDYQHFEKKAE